MEPTPALTMRPAAGTLPRLEQPYRRRSRPTHTQLRQEPSDAPATDTGTTSPPFAPIPLSRPYSHSLHRRRPGLRGYRRLRGQPTAAASSPPPSDFVFVRPDGRTTTAAAGNDDHDDGDVDGRAQQHSAALEQFKRHLADNKLTVIRELSPAGNTAHGGVYEVERRDGKRFALKWLLLQTEVDSPINDPDFVPTRLREMRASRMLRRHPNLIAVEAIGSLGSDDYILLELLDGSLQDLLAARDELGEPLSQAELLALFEQLLVGLAEVHRVGLVHKDINPTNVFFTCAAPAAVVQAPFSALTFKLGDFGLSEPLGMETGHDARAPLPGFLLPPEFLEYNRLNTAPYAYHAPCNDVWMLGATMLIAALTAQPPVPQCPLADVDRSGLDPVPLWMYTETTDILHCLPAALDAARRCCGDVVADLLADMLHVDGTRRPSAKEALARLCLLVPPTSAPPLPIGDTRDDASAPPIKPAADAPSASEPDPDQHTLFQHAAKTLMDVGLGIVNQRRKCKNLKAAAFYAELVFFYETVLGEQAEHVLDADMRSYFLFSGALLKLQEQQMLSACRDAAQARRVLPQVEELHAEVNRLVNEAIAVGQAGHTYATKINGRALADADLCQLYCLVGRAADAKQLSEAAMDMLHGAVESIRDANRPYTIFQLVRNLAVVCGAWLAADDLQRRDGSGAGAGAKARLARIRAVLAQLDVGEQELKTHDDALKGHSQFRDFWALGVQRLQLQMAAGMVTEALESLSGLMEIGRHDWMLQARTLFAALNLAGKALAPDDDDGGGGGGRDALQDESAREKGEGDDGDDDGFEAVVVPPAAAQLDMAVLAERLHAVYAEHVGEEPELITQTMYGIKNAREHLTAARRAAQHSANQPLADACAELLARLEAAHSAFGQKRDSEF